MAEDPGLLDRATAAIDEANSADPNIVSWGGAEHPKELVHAERMTYWLSRLAPAATVDQQIAARAHHLRRWALPRSDYPEGRAGYHRWRNEQGKRQAREVAEVLDGVGAPKSLVESVQSLVAKQRPAGDAAAATHEDALCLVFLDLQLEELADRLGDEHTVDVLRRSIAKMTPAGRALAADVDLSPRATALIHSALVTP